MAGHGGGGGHGGRHQVRAAAFALPAFEVAVAGRGAGSPGSSLSGFIARHMLQPASRHSKPASLKNIVEPLGFGLPLDQAAAGHDHRAYAAGDAMPADHGGRGSQVFDAGRWCTSR